MLIQKKKLKKINKSNNNLKEDQLIKEIVNISRKNIRRKTSKLFSTPKIKTMFDENEDLIKKSISLSNTKIKLIIFCLFNIIFYPPFTNKIFIGSYKKKNICLSFK